MSDEKKAAGSVASLCHARSQAALIWWLKSEAAYGPSKPPGRAESGAESGLFIVLMCDDKGGSAAFPCQVRTHEVC